MTSIFREARFGWRLLARQPGFTAVVVATLALGIGVNTALFSVFNGILLETLPFERADDLVYIMERTSRSPSMWVAYENFLDWRERCRVCDSMAAHRYEQFSMSTGEGSRESTIVILASAELFSMLPAEPQLGRTFRAEEDRPGGPRVAVISHELWQRGFGGRADVLGKVLKISSTPYEVVGVMPRGFLYPQVFRQAEVWLPIGLFARDWGRRQEEHPGIAVTARLRPGKSLKEAREDLDRIAGELAREHPETNSGHGVRLELLRDRLVRDVRPWIVVVSGAVAMVLLLACVNVASLLLARGTHRRHEIALRVAMGARPWHLIRHLLSESVALALAGGAVGVVVAWLCLRGLLSELDLAQLPMFGEITIDGPVLAFNLGITVLAGLLFGLVPAAAAVKGNTVEALAEGARGSLSRRRGRVLSALVVLQIALALLLSISALLCIRSFHGLSTADPGFARRDVLSLAFDLPLVDYPDEASQAAFFERLVTRVEGLPGVERAARSMPILVGWSASFSVVGQPRPEDEELTTEMLKVSPGYFETLGIELLRGRVFTDQDHETAPGVVIVDELFARTIWPQQDPLRRRLRLGTDAPGSPGREVVGVVRHVNNRGVHRPSRMMLYQPDRQAQLPYAYLLVRTDRAPHRLTSAIDRAVQELDPTIALNDVRTLEERLRVDRLNERQMAVLLTIFAFLAAGLAGVGTFGLLVYSVSRRRRELGIRMALGSTPADIFRLVIRRGLRLALTGIALGAGLTAVVVAPLLESRLYGVSTRDPGTWLVLSTGVVLVALIACLVPARRACRVEPVAVLREQ